MLKASDMLVNILHLLSDEITGPKHASMLHCKPTFAQIIYSPALAAFP